MNYGARLVIPGTIIGSLFLVIMLLAITASTAFPVTARAAGPAATPQPSSSMQVDPSIAESIPPIDAQSVEINQTANAGTGTCQVSPSFPSSVLQWCDLITRYADSHGLEPDLVAGLILQESGGDPTAYSKSGAVGLMQVMPKDGLAADFMCPNGPCFSGRPSTEKLQDPEFNIAYGTKMLADLLEKYGNLRDALRSYGPMDVGYYYADKVLGIFNTYGQ